MTAPAIRLVQYHTADGARHVGRVSADGDHLHPIVDTSSVLELEYEIEAEQFGKPLRNRMEPVPDEGPVRVTQL